MRMVSGIVGLDYVVSRKNGEHGVKLAIYTSAICFEKEN